MKFKEEKKNATKKAGMELNDENLERAAGGTGNSSNEATAAQLIEHKMYTGGSRDFDESKIDLSALKPR